MIFDLFPDLHPALVFAIALGAATLWTAAVTGLVLGLAAIHGLVGTLAGRVSR